MWSQSLQTAIKVFSQLKQGKQNILRWTLWMWFPNSDKRFLTSPTRAAKQITVRGAIKKMSQIVEKVHKGGEGGQSQNSVHFKCRLTLTNFFRNSNNWNLTLLFMIYGTNIGLSPPPQLKIFSEIFEFYNCDPSPKHPPLICWNISWNKIDWKGK